MTPMRQHPRQQTDVKAVLALLFGFCSFVVGPAAGIPALIFGSVARRDIARSGGALTGGSFARVGTLAGFFGTGFFAVLVLWLGSAFIAAPTEAALHADDSAAQTKITAPARLAPEHHALDPIHSSR